MIVYTFNNKVLRDSSNKWLGKYIDKDVLYYDNNSYTSETSWSNKLSTSVAPTRRWVVVMFNQSASNVVSAWAAGIRFTYGINNWYMRAHYLTGNTAPLRYGSNYTGVATGVSNRTVDGNISYYYSPLKFNASKVYKFVIDTSTNTDNVRQYINTDTLERTLIGYGGLICSDSISALEIRNDQFDKAIITLSNIIIAQFDKEEDALVYNGEQTV